MNRCLASSTVDGLDSGGLLRYIFVETRNGAEGRFFLRRKRWRVRAPHGNDATVIRLERQGDCDVKKILMGLGIAFAGVFVAAAVGFVLLNQAGGRLDRESKAYVDEVVPVIVGSWDSHELVARASPELLQAVPPEKLEILFEIFLQRLGPLQEYQGSVGRANIAMMQQHGEVVTGEYLARGQFEKAAADIRVRTIQRDDIWSILLFYVDSEALVP